MRTVHLTVLALLLATAACAPRAHDSATAHLPITTDSSRLAVRGGEIWYRVTGRDAGIPVILLHGGPGLSSVYLKSLEALADERLVVRYDQLGSGRSDVVTDTSLFTIARFVEELETLRRHLAVEKVHVYGHSWGATLAVEYYRVHPGRVASLVLASSALDFPAFFGSLRRVFAALPDSLYRAVQLRDAGLEYDAAHLQAAAMAVNSRHGTRRPVLADMDSMMKSVNNALNDYMTGTTVLTPGGTLKDYDATSFLKEITVPVLFVAGEFDFAGPDIIRQHASLTPGARLVVVPDAGHTMQWDNAPAHLDAVRSFLREVDGRRDPVEILRGMQLDTLAGAITVFHSRSHEERARDMQRLYQGAIAFYESRLGEDFDVALAVLNEPDWIAFEIPGTGPLRPPQAVMPYGFPHTDFYGYISGSLPVVVLPAESDRGALADAARQFGLQDQVGRFVDVIGFHEFGHYMIEQYLYSHLPPCPAPTCRAAGRYRGPSLRWLDEFLATYIGQGYLWHAEGFDSDPLRLSIYDGHTPTYRSLREFEEQYTRFATAPDGMINLGWYQAHFAELARVMFARYGPDLVPRLKAELPWDRFHDWTTEEILAALELIAPGFVAWAEQLTDTDVPDASSTDTTQARLRDRRPKLTATSQDH